MAGLFSKLNIFTKRDVDQLGQEAEMATEASSHLICAICLEYFRSPKLLPCAHTFCLQCVADLARRHASSTTTSGNNRVSFPCSACRRQVVVPPGGVSALPNNIYLSPADMERSRLASSTQCRTHPDHLRRFLCLECDDFICSLCKLTQHTNHRTKDLMLTEEENRGDNSAGTGSDESVQKEVENMKKELSAALKAAHEEWNNWTEKRKSVENQVNARAKQITALTRAAQNAALSELKTVSSAEHDKHKSNVELLKTLLADLEPKQKSAEPVGEGVNSGDCGTSDGGDETVTPQKAIESKDDDGQIKDTKSVGGIQENVKDSESKTTSAEDDAKKTSFTAEESKEIAPTKPPRSLQEVLQDARKALSEQSTNIPHASLICQTCSVHPDGITKYIGNPRILSVPKMAPVVSLKRAFRSGTDDNSEIHTIFVVKETGRVWLCQQLSAKDSNDYRKVVFTLGGNKINIQSDKTPARVTWKMLVGSMFVSQGFYSKGSSLFRLGSLANPKVPMSRVVTLQPKFTDQGTVQCVDVLVGDIQAQGCLGFDVSPDEQLFAVVAEAIGSEASLKQQRKVLLFRRGESKPVATYTPPDLASFFPSDVCFYAIGGVTVLLVADWLGDSVHLVHVSEERMSFVRHLAADCAELVKPGALTTDWAGRLWIGCRGGTVLQGSPIVTE